LREGRTLFVESLSASVNGVSANLADVFANEAATFQFSVNGVRVYLDMLTDEFKMAQSYSYSFRYNILLWKYSYLGGVQNGYIKMLHVQDKVAEILDRLIAGAPEATDYPYLNVFKSSLDELLASLQNEDGSVNKKALDRDYLTSRINEFLRDI
jgi:hypothetical protein